MASNIAAFSGPGVALQVSWPTAFAKRSCECRPSLSRRESRRAVISSKMGTEPLTALRTLLPPESSSVQTLTGEKVDIVQELLGSQDDAVIVGWLRHFGCTLCAKQASNWDTKLRQLLAQGPCAGTDFSVRLALVGSGTVKQANEFKSKLNYSGELFTDSSLETYGALGFAKGAKSVFNLPALIKTIKSFAEGHQQRWSVRATDPLLQGGALVVNKDGTVILLHRDKYAGDHASMDALAAAVNQIFVATGPIPAGSVSTESL